MDFGYVLRRNQAQSSTGRAPEWSPKREMPVLASQALVADPFPRFLQARPARKPRLADPKCSSAATQISPTRLKPPKMAVFVTISPQRVLLRIFRPSTRRPRPKSSFAREYWLRNVAALACCVAPQGRFGHFCCFQRLGADGQGQSSVGLVSLRERGRTRSKNTALIYVL